MAWLDAAVPNWAQWLGLLATVAGTVFALWAAISAKGAKQQAIEAKLAAVRLVRTLELSDLISEMQELYALFAQRDFESIYTKAFRLRGRVVRFSTQMRLLLSEEQATELDAVDKWLQSLTDIATTSKINDNTRIARIRFAVERAHDALNRVSGTQQMAIHGVEDENRSRK